MEKSKKGKKYWRKNSKSITEIDVAEKNEITC
jgi:hypothetical protein